MDLINTKLYINHVENYLKVVVYQIVQIQWMEKTIRFSESFEALSNASQKKYMNLIKDRGHLYSAVFTKTEMEKNFLKDIPNDHSHLIASDKYRYKKHYSIEESLYMIHHL